MIYKNFAKLFLILTLTTLACGLPTASTNPTTVPVQEATLAPTEIPPIQQLTVDQLKNVQYQLGVQEQHTVIQLTDGQYQQGTDPTSLDFAYAGVTEYISIGDLTGDGINEAAAIFFENYGGTGQFGFLTIYSNVNGLPVFLYSVMIDDRPIINSMSIENGEVFLDAVTHGFEDAGCCPMLGTTRRYVLANNQLRMVNYTTATPDGTKRVIEITSPINGAEVTGSLQVSGNVSTAPFENNLSYFIYDEVGNQIAAGPVAVSAPDLGAPGTFNETFTLEGIPAGTTIYLELQDISAADGSWLAMDAVKLIVK
ncbi:MAG: hypothetical protein H7Y59_19875 [Anaerolineales bacterium]|nr:hypothetical protein [Anaerolineales bacterium]